MSCTISRRHILGLLPLACASAALAQAKPHEARFFSAGFDGARHVGGLHVRMAPGWKTYWRVPGAGGIPPEIKAMGTNIAGFSFELPLPHRISGADGESIGYKDEVVFPWSLIPADPALPVEAALSAFVGVCETVCIPVTVQDALRLKPIAMATRETALLAQWQARVPRTQDVIGSVAAVAVGATVFIDVTLKAPARDIFIEGDPLHFFAAPAWSEPGTSARITVHGAKSADELAGRELRITLDVNGEGLEQTVRVR